MQSPDPDLAPVRTVEMDNGPINVRLTVKQQK